MIGRRGPLFFFEEQDFSPAALLAYDEALLHWMDSQQPDFALFRLWEPRDIFVVMGYGKRVAEDVTIAAVTDAVPILRRCSGGGTVLQLPGCLSYSLIAPISWHPDLDTIHATTTSIMTTQAAYLSRYLGKTVSVKGASDLTLGSLKFSGNAQRRGRHSVLFHGAFLCQIDLSVISRYLQIPGYQPEYRQNRQHEDFLCTLDLSPKTLASYLKKEWQVCENYAISLDMTDLCEKYLRREWTHLR